jgi:hypothetical protein
MPDIFFNAPCKKHGAFLFSEDERDYIRKGPSPIRGGQGGVRIRIRTATHTFPRHYRLY